MVSKTASVATKQLVKRKMPEHDDVLDQLEASLRDVKAGRVRRVRPLPNGRKTIYNDALVLLEASLRDIAAGRVKRVK